MVPSILSVICSANETINEKTMEIGQKIKVYSDPLIESTLEGTAILVMKSTPGTSKKGFEVWQVRFPDKQDIVNRIVHERNVDWSPE